ncbi:MAG TPA: Lpg1974 family pore-forming outer membrane protein [Thermoguttaceae bacterium]|nr:Lpg1974 family pore-forming outer membrane protein [Thermoguttaceae bacterium]
MTLFARLTLAFALIACCSTARADGVTPFGDVLYWHASAEASSVWSNAAYEGSSFSAENVPFDWNPGFRVGFGHEWNEQSWDIKLYWTYFRTSQDASVSVADTTHNAVVPEFFSGFVGGVGLFSQGSLDWRLAYNTIDLEIGRRFALGESAWIRPSMGLKTAFLQQDVHLNFARPDAEEPLLSVSAEENITHDFWGIGPSFGVSGGWRLPRCARLSLVGSFAADLLFGQWNVNDEYTRTDLLPPIETYGAFTTSMTDSYLGTPVLRYYLGLEWAHQGQVAVSARVGYELQWWANQQRMLAFQQLPMHGDLTLEGLTCGVSIGF